MPLLKTNWTEIPYLMHLPFNTVVFKGLRGDGGSRDPRRVFLPTSPIAASAAVFVLLVSLFSRRAVPSVGLFKGNGRGDESNGSCASSPLVSALLTCLSVCRLSPGREEKEEPEPTEDQTHN